MNMKITIFSIIFAVLQARIVMGIVGGLPAHPHQNKNLVAIQIWTDNRFITICGGTPVAPFWAATSGSCIQIMETYPNPVRDVLLLAGIVNIRKRPEYGQYLRIVHYIKHENFELVKDIIINDIGMVKTADPGFRETAYVAIYPISQARRYPIGSTNLAGWGGLKAQTNNARYYPDMLQTLPAEFIDLEDCKDLIKFEYRRRHRSMIDFGLFDEKFICTGPLSRGQSMCAGDFGGPLVQQVANGTFEVVGIQSRKHGTCGRINTPSVHMNALYFKRWIVGIQEEFD